MKKKSAELRIIRFPPLQRGIKGDFKSLSVSLYEREKLRTNLEE